MINDIQTISSIYMEHGKHVLSAIGRVLDKYQISVSKTTPAGIDFVPWSLIDPDIKCSLRGNLTYNTIDSYVTIRYVIAFTESKLYSSYSRFLKWYLLKWSEERKKIMKKKNIVFLYPGNTGSEIILQASQKISQKDLDKPIKDLIFDLDDIINDEARTINDILKGDFPDSLKKDLLREIDITLAEMGQNQPEDKQHDIIRTDSQSTFP